MTRTCCREEEGKSSAGIKGHDRQKRLPRPHLVRLLCRTAQSSPFFGGAPLPSSDVRTRRRRRRHRARLSGKRYGGRRYHSGRTGRLPGEFGRGHAPLSIVQDERAYIHQRIDLDIKLVPSCLWRRVHLCLNCRSHSSKCFGRRDDIAVATYYIIAARLRASG